MSASRSWNPVRMPLISPRCCVEVVEPVVGIVEQALERRRTRRPTRRWLTANSSDSARSIASLDLRRVLVADAGDLARRPPMRFRSTALRSTMRAYWAAWTAVGVWFERVPR